MIKKILSIGLIALFATACSKGVDQEEDGIKELVVGLLPVDTNERLQNRYTPLFNYISSEIGIPYRLVITRDYNHLLELFHKQEINFAVFGGVSFVKAHKTDAAVPLVARSQKKRFTTYFLVKTDDPRHEFAEFKDAIIGFGSKLSTSGHLMPRYFLDKQNIIPETFFSEVKYMGKHYKTAMAVRDGIVDIGAVNSAVVDKMFEDGTLLKSQVRILWNSPPFPDQVLAVHPAVSESMRIKIRDAFLNLTPSTPEKKAMLDNISADGFLPIGVNEFAQLAKVVEEQGLL